MHVWGAKSLNELQLQTAAGRPFWIGSQNCSRQIDNRCSVTVVLHLIWFQFCYNLEMVVHTNACLGCKIVKRTSTSNSCRGAILDWFAKLLDAHQQQVLRYCCTSLNLISVLRRLRNHCSHKCMSWVQSRKMNFNFKLLQGGHIGSNPKIAWPASAAYRVLRLSMIS